MKKICLLTAVSFLLVGCGNTDVDYLEGTYSGIRPEYTVTFDGEESHFEEGKEIFSFDKDGGCAYYSEQDHDWAYTCKYEKTGNSEFTVYTQDKDKLTITTGPGKNAIATVKKDGIEFQREYAGGLNLKYTIPKTSEEYTDDDPHRFFAEAGVWDIDDNKVWNYDESIYFFSCAAGVSIYDDGTITVHAYLKDGLDDSYKWTIDCEHAQYTLEKGTSGNVYYISDNGKQLGYIFDLNGNFVLFDNLNAKAAIVLAEK